MFSYFEKGYYAMNDKKFITNSRFNSRFNTHRTYYWFTEALKPYKHVIKLDI